MKIWIKNRLERAMLMRPFVRTDLVKQSCFASSRDCLHIIIPHRLNWDLTSATIYAFNRLTTGKFSITLVVNFDSIPKDWEGFQLQNLTILRNHFSPLGELYRKLFKSENGSMFNALGIATGINACPLFEWAFIAHNDSAPLALGWNSHFQNVLGGGLVAGNSRDLFRVFAAHSSGTLFHQGEFLRRMGSVWPKYRFGKMQHDVSDGITLALHREKNQPVPVLPNTLQSPELKKVIEQSHPLLYEFADNGTLVSFDPSGQHPVFAHMGRGTPRSQSNPTFSHKLPVDYWIQLINEVH